MSDAIAVCALCDPTTDILIRDAAADSREAARRLLDHYNRAHGHLADIPDLSGPGQDWHTRALAEVRRLAATGQEFTIWQVAQAVGDPDDHKSRLGSFANELDHLGIAHVVRYDRSLRPGSKSSAAAVWRGGRNPSKESNVA